MDEINLHRFAEKLELHGFAKRTIEGYCGFVKMFLAWLTEHESINELADLGPEHITAYQAYLQFGRSESGGKSLGRGGLANHLYALKVFLGIMADDGLVGGDCAARIVAPKLRKGVPRHVPAPEKMKKIIEAAIPASRLGIRDRAILELLYASGIRSEELRTLTLDDWDETANTLFITGKGSKDRIVPVGAWVVPYLHAYLTKSRPYLCRAGSRLFFVSKTGAQIARANLAWIVRKYAAKADIASVCVHTFRHACATHLLENGADIRYVQELLGHASLNTTQVYTRVTIDSLKVAHRQYHPRERDSHTSTGLGNHGTSGA
jgi:integrase/recombinase XerD